MTTALIFYKHQSQAMFKQDQEGIIFVSSNGQYAEITEGQMVEYIDKLVAMELARGK